MVPTPANVSVLVRIRPLNKKELTKKGSIGRTNVLRIYDGNCDDTNTEKSKKNATTMIHVATAPELVELVGQKNGEPASHTVNSSAGFKKFNFDAVLGPRSTQSDVFGCTKNIVAACAHGYNGTIMAYGQTGSGKTHTVFGHGDESVGLVQRSLRALFHGIAMNRAAEVVKSAQKISKQRRNLDFMSGNEDGNLSDDCRLDNEYTESPADCDVSTETLTTVHASFLEIFNERIYDLLSEEESKLENALPVREDAAKGGVYVEGLREVKVENTIEAEAVLNRGIRNRHVASTAMNRTSSRSHAVFVLKIRAVYTTKDGLSKVRTSKFTLVDLAGSERQKSTDAAGARLKEASMINKSLTSLGHVINALVDREAGKDRHVHYRDSKLTFLLRDSLGGNSKTCLVATVSPSAASLGETLSTLKFAQRAKLIRNTVVLNEDVSGTVAALQAELTRLRSKLENAEANHAISARSAFTPALSSSSSFCCDAITPFGNTVRNDGGKSPDVSSQTLQRKAENAEEKAKSLKARLSEERTVTRTLKRKLDEERMIRKFKQARIDHMRKKMREVTPEDEDEDVIVLCNEVDSLRRQLDAPNPEAIKWRAAYKRIKDKLDEKITGMGKKSAYQTDCIELENEIERLASEKHAVERRLTVLTKELKSISSSTEVQISKLNEKIKDMTSEVNSERQKVQSAEDRMTSKDVTINALKEELDTTHKKLETVNSELAQERETGNQLATEAERLMDEIEAKAAQVDHANRELRKAEADLKEKRDVLDDYQNSSRTMSLDNQATENDLRERLAAVSKDNVILINRLQEASQNLESKKDEAESFRSRIRTLEKEYDVAVVTKKECDEARFVLEDKFKRLREEHESMTRIALKWERMAEEEKLSKDVALEKETQRIKEDKLQLQQKIRQLEVECKDLKEEVTSLEVDVSHEKDRVKRLEGKLLQISKERNALEIEQAIDRVESDKLRVQEGYWIEKNYTLEEENLRLRRALEKSEEKKDNRNGANQKQDLVKGTRLASPSTCIRSPDGAMALVTIDEKNELAISCTQKDENALEPLNVDGSFDESAFLPTSPVGVEKSTGHDRKLSPSHAQAGGLSDSPPKNEVLTPFEKKDTIDNSVFCMSATGYETTEPEVSNDTQSQRTSPCIENQDTGDVQCKSNDDAGTPFDESMFLPNAGNCSTSLTGANVPNEDLSHTIPRGEDHNPLDKNDSPIKLAPARKNAFQGEQDCRALHIEPAVKRRPLSAHNNNALSLESIETPSKVTQCTPFAGSNKKKRFALSLDKENAHPPESLRTDKKIQAPVPFQPSSGSKTY